MGGGGAVAQSVERVTPGEEVLGSMPTMANLSLPVGSVSQYVKLSDVSLGTRLR